MRFCAYGALFLVCLLSRENSFVTHSDLKCFNKSGGPLLAQGQVIGLDFGSEFIKAALVAAGKRMDIVLNPSSQRKELNAVSFAEPSERRLGEEGGAQATKKPEAVFVHSNLFLGLSAKDVGTSFPYDAAPSYERVEPTNGRWPSGLSSSFFPFKLLTDSTRGALALEVRENVVFPVEMVCANILSHVRQLACKAAGLPTSASLGAVVTIPCSYTQRQRAALRDALEIASINVLGLVHAGAAAAVHHALDLPADTRTTKMFLDVGSSIVDVTIVKFAPVGEDIPAVEDKSADAPKEPTTADAAEGAKEGEAKTTTPEKKKSSKPAPSALSVTVIGCKSGIGGGGLHADQEIADLMRSSFETQRKISLDKFPRTLKKLLKQAGASKKVLSANKQANFFIENLHDGVDFQKMLQRDEFEKLLESSGSLENVKSMFQGAVDNAGIDFSSIDEVELLGGSWRVPKVQEFVSTLTGSIPVGTHLNGDEAMATGAGFIAANNTSTFRVRHMELNDSGPYEYKLKFYENTHEHLANGENQKEKILFEKFKKMSKSKSATLKVQNDFAFELLEDTHVLGTYKVTGVPEGIAKFEAAMTEEEKKVLESKNTLSKATVQFSIDSAGVINVDRATLSLEVPAVEPASAENDAAEGAAKPKAKPTSKQLSHTLTISSSLTVPHPLSDEQKKELRVQLKALEKSDAELHALLEAMNKLEALIYSSRAFLQTEPCSKVLAEGDMNRMLLKLDELEDWIYDSARAEGIDAVQTKLKEISVVINPAKARAQELEKRPKVIEKISKALVDATSRLQQITANRPWIPESNIQAVQKLRDDTEIWWETKSKQQELQADTEEPAFTEDDVFVRLSDLSAKLKALEHIRRPTTTTTTKAPETPEENAKTEATTESQKEDAETPTAGTPLAEATESNDEL